MHEPKRGYGNREDDPHDAEEGFGTPNGVPGGTFQAGRCVCVRIEKVSDEVFTLIKASNVMIMKE